MKITRENDLLPINNKLSEMVNSLKVLCFFKVHGKINISLLSKKCVRPS